MIKDILHREDLITPLQKTTDELVALLDLFSEKTINTVPFEGSWTAAQVADHITRSNTSITKALLLKGTAINRNPGERIEELKELFLNFRNKLKSPDFIVPAQDIYERETVIGHLKQSVQKMQEISTTTNLSEMINHPAFGDITKFEVLHFVLYHTQRHIHQLEKIFQVVSGR
ncbi:MAG: DinB family protein [Chitinophagaceae bacterium]